MNKLFRQVEVRRNQLLRARVTQAERELIMQRSLDAGVSVSDYLRSCALRKSMRSRVAATIINELIRLNAQLKEHCVGIEQNEERNKQLHEILVGVADAIEHINDSATEFEIPM